MKLLNQYRFNPAYAGNVPCPEYRACVAQVHPRVCGEYEDAGGYADHSGGSTPPVRGISSLIVTAQSCIRFNPACAGNINWGTIYRPPKEGSPPRMRGIFEELGMGIAFERFNPACAGNMENQYYRELGC